jgi:cytochrome c oxidase subunit IV
MCEEDTDMAAHAESRKVYYAIFAALLTLTYLTVAVARVDLGRLNTIVALTIAVTKAVLVVLFFMHVRHSSRLTKLVVVGGFVWLALLIGLTMLDITSRGWLGIPGR